MTLKIIISHTFPENFIEITQVVQKILSLSLSIFLWLFLAIFIIFWIFWHFLVTKKRMMTAYNRWCQHFFSFNVLQINSLTIVKVFHVSSWNVTTQYDPLNLTPLSSSPEKTNLRKPSFIRFNYRSTRTKCEIYSKLTIKTPERRHWRRSSVFIVNFEHISCLVLVFLLLTLIR